MADPESLPVHCALCGGKLRMLYQPTRGPDGETSIENIYGCPHCRKQVRVSLPGSLVEVRTGHLEPQALMQRVREWQASPYVRPMTCGNDSEHRKLEPFEKDGAISLRCRLHLPAALDS